MNTFKFFVHEFGHYTVQVTFQESSHITILDNEEQASGVMSVLVQLGFIYQGSVGSFTDLIISDATLSALQD